MLPRLEENGTAPEPGTAADEAVGEVTPIEETDSVSNCSGEVTRSLPPPSPDKSDGRGELLFLTEPSLGGNSTA
jgi:hypothetical protein